MVQLVCENAGICFPLIGPSFRLPRRKSSVSAKDDAFVKPRLSRAGVQALRGINIEIKAGMRVGVVGENGSGKTTFLKLLGGIFQPTAGRVIREGKISCLISSRSGFDPKATGRENIELRSFLQGVRPKDLAESMDDIIAFSGIGEFIDLPISTYSAGMSARLAFSIATAFAADIVLIDEGILAGDEAFRERAKDRMNAFFEGTGLLVIAAHHRGMIQRMCSHVLWLDQGEARMFGDAEPVLEAYSEFIRERAKVKKQPAK